MKMGQVLDSSKAIVLGVVIMALLVHSPAAGRAISLNLSLLPNEGIISEFTLIDTSLETVKPHAVMDFTEWGLTGAETGGLIEYSLPSQSLIQSRGSFVTPRTTPFKPRQNSSAFLITALSSTLILQAADYISTLNALKYSSLQEGNPFLKNVVNDPLLFGAVKLCVTGLQIAFLKKIHDNNRTLAWIFGTAMNVAVSFVVANNFSKIQRARNL